MRALEFITGHVIYNPAHTYKFKLKTTEGSCSPNSYFPIPTLDHPNQQFPEQKASELLGFVVVLMKHFSPQV